MPDRALRWRLGFLAAGVLTIGLAWSAGVFETKKAIVIDYGMAPDRLIGSQVYIDDELAGELEQVSRAPRTGFEVSEGSHVVQIVHPELLCDPIRVKTQGSQTAVTLRLDLTSVVDPATGETRGKIFVD